MHNNNEPSSDCIALLSTQDAATGTVRLAKKTGGERKLHLEKEIAKIPDWIEDLHPNDVQLLHKVFHIPSHSAAAAAAAQMSAARGDGDHRRVQMSRRAVSLVRHRLTREGMQGCKIP